MIKENSIVKRDSGHLTISERRNSEKKMRDYSWESPQLASPVGMLEMKFGEKKRRFVRWKPCLTGEDDRSSAWKLYLSEKHINWKKKLHQSLNVNKKTSLMMICVQKNTSVTKRVQNENYVTIISHFPILFLAITMFSGEHELYGETLVIFFDEIWFLWWSCLNILFDV